MKNFNNRNTEIWPTLSFPGSLRIVKVFDFWGEVTCQPHLMLIIRKLLLLMGGCRILKISTTPQAAAHVGTDLGCPYQHGQAYFEPQ